MLPLQTHTHKHTRAHTHTHPWQELQEARAPSKISLITIRKHLINQAWLTKVHARPPCPRHEGEDSFNFLTKAVWAPHTGHLATCHLFSMIPKRQWIGIQIMHKSFLKIPGQLQRQRKMCDMQPHWVPGWTDSLFEVIIHFFNFIFIFYYYSLLIENNIKYSWCFLIFWLIFFLLLPNIIAVSNICVIGHFVKVRCRTATDMQRKPVSTPEKKSHKAKFQY